jgi:alpha-1,3-rhamnosyl/mannosyltransferase
VLCLGTIEPRKNHRTLLQAWRRLPPGSARLVVVGRVGWQCDDIVRELAAGVAEGRWTWHRDLADDELWPLFASARALVFPSWFEGFGFPPLEAMRLGLPVVAHDGPPMRELGDGVFGFADAADPAALAAAIERALQPAAAAAAAVAGPRRAAAFTWAACAAAHAALYREVAAC